MSGQYIMGTITPIFIKLGWNVRENKQVILFNPRSIQHSGYIKFLDDNRIQWQKNKSECCIKRSILKDLLFKCEYYLESTKWAITIAHMYLLKYPWVLKLHCWDQILGWLNFLQIAHMYLLWWFFGWNRQLYHM